MRSRIARPIEAGRSARTVAGSGARPPCACARSSSSARSRNGFPPVASWQAPASSAVSPPDEIRSATSSSVAAALSAAGLTSDTPGSS